MKHLTSVSEEQTQQDTSMKQAAHRALWGVTFQKAQILITTAVDVDSS
jgi:hypothetical protein